eukprot:3195113-Prymnesium_polylepis.1
MWGVFAHPRIFCSLSETIRRHAHTHTHTLLYRTSLGGDNSDTTRSLSHLATVRDSVRLSNGQCAEAQCSCAATRTCVRPRSVEVFNASLRPPDPREEESSDR